MHNTAGVKLEQKKIELQMKESLLAQLGHQLEIGYSRKGPAFIILKRGPADVILRPPVGCSGCSRWILQ